MVRHIDDGTLRVLASQDYRRLTGDGLTDPEYERIEELAPLLKREASNLSLLMRGAA